MRFAVEVLYKPNGRDTKRVSKCQCGSQHQGSSKGWHSAWSWLGGLQLSCAEAERPLCLQTGFLSAGKKGSMFSVPEGVDSKVGVINSGKGMTQQAGGTRHEFTI